ncbi:hypothetical protein ACFL5V_05590 [Fibrobacterota bacterium]
MKQKSVKKEPLPRLTGPLSRFELAVACLAFLWCFCLLYNQFFTLTKITSLLKPTSYFGTLTHFWKNLGKPDSALKFSQTDWLVFGLIFLIPVVVILIEYESGALRKLCRRIIGNKKLEFIIVPAFFLLISRHYLHPGDFPYTADGNLYMASAKEFYENLKMGFFSNYSTAFYSGSVCRQYMGNLFAALAGTSGWIFGFFPGVKLFLLLCNALSGLGAYLLARQLTRNYHAALVCGFTYCLNFWHFYQLMVMGRHHLSLMYLCMPWPFFFLERALTRSGGLWRNTALCAPFILIATYNHFVWGMYLFGLVVLYAIIRISSNPEFRKDRSLIIHIGLAFCLTFLMTVGKTSAPFVKKHDSMANYTASKSPKDIFALSKENKIQLHTLYTWHNGHISFTKPHKRSWYNSYLGLSIFVFALLGLFLLKRRWGADRSKVFTSGIFFIGSFIPVFFYYELCRFSLFKTLFFFPNERYQTFFVYFMSVSAAFGVLFCHRLISGFSLNHKLKRVLILLPLTLATLDIGPTSFQHPTGKTNPWIVPTGAYKTFERMVNNSRLKEQLLPYNIFVEQVSVPEYVFWGSGKLMRKIGASSIGGTEPQTAPRQFLYTYNIINDLDKTLKAIYNDTTKPFPTHFFSDFFFLWNFKEGLFHLKAKRSYFKNQFRFLERLDNFVHGPFARSSPIIASLSMQPGNLESLSLEEAEPIKKLFRDMKINQTTKTAETIFFTNSKNPKVRSYQGTRHLNLPEGDSLRLAVTDFIVKPKKYIYHVKTGSDCFVRLYTPYFSFLKVKVNNKPVDFFPTATWNVGLRLPKGEHIIVTEGGWDPYVLGGNILSLLVLALTCFLGYRYRDELPVLRRWS